jgi:DMSO/TMAO reductase YedYZ molybdopterin-dependent catalytic subunit
MDQLQSHVTILTVDGLVESPLSLALADLAGFPEIDHVHDVSRFQPKRRGDGVTLEAILSRVGPKPEANYLTLHASKDDFHVSVPLNAVRGEGIVVYRVGDQPLGPDEGGPIRFLIRDPAACHTDELDDCANVKFLDRIELSQRRARDTRPKTDEEHEALHRS